AGEQLDRRGVLHVERLEHDARDADRLPALARARDGGGIAPRQAGRAPGRLAVRDAREDLARLRQARLALARVAAHDIGHHQGAADGLRLAALRAAERVEHGALGGVLLARDARGVPLVGAGGDDRQRALLTTPADDQGHAAAGRQGVALGIAERVVRLLERHRPALPERADRSEEHTSELQSLRHLVCRLLLEKKKGYRYDRAVTAVFPGYSLLLLSLY